MSKEETVKLVVRLISEICEIDKDKVTVTGKLVGFGLDSVRILDLIMAVEEELDIEISENDPELGGVQTVDDLVGMIERRRG